MWNNSWQIEREVAEMETRLTDNNLLSGEYHERNHKRRSRVGIARQSKMRKRDEDQGVVWGT